MSRLHMQNHVDVEITQGSVSHTWSDYHFGDFSGWVNIFKVGTGTFTVWESIGGMPASFTRKFVLQTNCESVRLWSLLSLTNEYVIARLLFWRVSQGPGGHS